MKSEQILEILETAAKHVSVSVRYENLAVGSLSGCGGLCRLRGQWCVIVDKKAAPADKVSVLIDALSGFDTDGFFLPPKIREALQTRRALHAQAAAAAQAPSS